VNNRQAALVLRDTSPARIFARPTAEDLWLGPTRESVLSHLLHPAPCRVLLGPASSGRSSLLAHLAHLTEDQAITLRVPGPQTEPDGFLRKMLSSAGLEVEDLATDEMRRLISVYIRERLGKGQRVVIELDDADTFSAGAWQEVSTLLRLNTQDRGPELLMSLVHLDDGTSPAADHVRGQEAPVLSVLNWLEPREVSSYLHWRLERFDLCGIISPEAARSIAQCTQGCFASIDHICQMTLLLLRKHSGHQISVNLVREATRMLQRRRQPNSATPVEPEDSDAMPAKVIVSHDGMVICETGFSNRLLIGRSELNDLCIDDAFLSRHHAAIIRTDRGYYLSDLNSVNGIGLNGQPVHSNRIVDGEVFSIGPFRIKLRVKEAVVNRQVNNQRSVPAELADTAVMRGPAISQPARLQAIK
jgi:pSer/pThr/pTyr-binding forkhead associated (FHA) protein